MRGPGHNLKGENHICAQCGAGFYVKPCVLASRPSVYCSATCRGMARRVASTRNCAACGKSYYRSPSILGEFCSKKCYGIRVGERWRGIAPSQQAQDAARIGRARTRGIPRKPVIDRICFGCNESFRVPRKGGARDRDRRRFCGKPCWYDYIRAHPEAIATFRGGREPYYGPNWAHQARKARARDGHCCQDCGKHQTRPTLDVHHVIPRRTFNGDYKAANQLANLVSLCKRHHKIREWLIDASHR